MKKAVAQARMQLSKSGCDRRTIVHTVASKNKVSPKSLYTALRRFNANKVHGLSLLSYEQEQGVLLSFL